MKAAARLKSMSGKAGGRDGRDFLFDHPVLPEGEIRGLIVRAQAGDIAARNEAVRCNMKLVLAVAGRYPMRPGYGWDEAISSGAGGLMRAVEKFDPDRTFDDRPIKFNTYAAWWIYQAMQRADLLIRGPIYVPIRSVKIGEATERASLRAISPMRDGDPLPGGPGAVFRLDRAVVGGESAGDLAGERDEARWRAEIVGRWLARLADRDAEVLAARYGLGGREPETQRAVGDRLGVTRQRIEQIESKALGRLRTWAAEAGIGEVA